MDRRTLLASFGALLAQAQNQNRPRSPIFQHDLPDITLHNWAVTAVEVDYAPSKGSNAHRHPGITVAYVLEGEIASKVGDEPEKIYKQGEMFIEYPNALHSVSRNASDSKSARLLAILLAEKGKQLTTPA